MTIISRRIQWPLLLPLLLVLAALHFDMVNFNIPDSAFQSIWPPHVLLFPFLCFLVAGASVASGEVGDLIPLVLSGCLLVHGHVAQPLFVVSLTFLTYIALCWRDGRSILRQVNSSPYVHASAVGILTIFLLPLVLDAFRGQQSNLHLILGHLFQHSADHKTFFQSLTISPRSYVTSQIQRRFGITSHRPASSSSRDDGPCLSHGPESESSRLF
jgi:hypothetical protein